MCRADVHGVVGSITFDCDQGQLGSSHLFSLCVYLAYFV